MKKELVILVGPQGSGKTTFCKNELSEHYRVSQDDMGKEGQKQAFLLALKTKNKIVVDRINHLHSQREWYLSKATEAGFQTKILVLQESFKTCYDRIVARQNHPALQADKAKQALFMFFSGYQKPRYSEADEVVFLGKDENYMLDITDKCKGKRVITIGDLHGCFDELQDLLLKVKYDKAKDVIVFVGDLCDRGPKIKECFEFVRNNPDNVYTVMSYHEHKLLRHLMGNKVNGSMLTTTLEQCEGYLDEDFTVWLANLPYIIKFGENDYALHAGINPMKPIDRQNKEFLMYCRNFSKENNSFSTIGAKPWYSFPYDGGNIYFGHSPLPVCEVAKHAFALDSGCVFGDSLRAYIPGDGVFEVLAHKVYNDKNEYKSYVDNPLLEYDDYVKKGLLNKKEENGKILYNYSDKCVFDKQWNDITKSARGLIFDAETKEVISPCMPKFFNLLETEETSLNNLPDVPFSCYEKVDGSYVSLSYHKGQWFTATRGSFNSLQAIAALKLLQEKYDLYSFNKNYTYIFEYISEWNRKSPGAKLCVDYGEREDVILLTIFNKLN